jgi:hypothetical protein
MRVLLDECLPARLRHVISISSLFLALFLTGCAYELHPYNTPSSQKLRVRASSPERYILCVAGEHQYFIPADGRITFEVPSLPRGCAVYLFGVVKVKDSTSEKVQAIHLLRDGKVVRKLSLTQLRGLPVDAEGNHLVVLR